MRTSTKTLHTSIITLLLILFIAMMPSWMCTIRTVIDGPGDMQPSAPAKKQEEEKRTVIVLLHGLGHVVDGVSGLESLKQCLESDLKGEKNVTVIAPARPASLTEALTKQVDDLYAELKKNHKDSKLIIYGHSQGGVLAASLWCEHKGDLNIKCLVLDRAPLAGFHPLALPNINGIAQVLGNELNTQTIPEMQGLTQYINNVDEPGIQGLSPTSSVIQRILDKLPSINIPVLLISGQADFIEFCDTFIPQNIKTLLMVCLSSTSMDALFGSPNDGLISCDSQTLNNLLSTKPNVTKESVSNMQKKDFVHGWCIASHAQMKTAYKKLVDHIKLHS